MIYYRTYSIAPDREWVVFVHGAGGSSSLWFRQIRAFQEHFNVLMVDLRGHGHSQTTPDGIHYSFEELSRDILEVMDHLEIDRAHFVGMSLGSILIRTLAEIAPERVSTLVLGGAVTKLTFRSRFLVGVGNLFKRVLPYLWLYKLFAWIVMPKRQHRRARLLFIREAKKLCQKEFLRWFKLTWRVNPLLRLFESRELAAPVLYLMGEDDHLFLPPVRALIEKQTNSVLQIIQGAGHVCNIDRPGAFNQHAISFIKTHAAGSLA